MALSGGAASCFLGDAQPDEDDPNRLARATTKTIEKKKKKERKETRVKIANCNRS